MATDAGVARLVEQHVTQSAIIRQRVLAFIALQWGALTAYRDDDVAAFVASITPVVEAGQIQVAALTDSYLAAVEMQVLGGTVRPMGVPARVVNDLAMRGVPTSQVYARTGPTVWTELSKGTDLDTAVKRGLDRALSTAQTDLQLARTHSSRYVMERKTNVVGYRRVLSGSQSCRLCVTASAQRYTKDRLAPIHNRCDCDVLPIYASEDPGRTINPELIAELKRQGIAGDLSLSQKVTRHRKQARDADERIADIEAELSADDLDPARKRKLEGDLKEWRSRKRSAEAKTKRAQDQLADYRGQNGRPKTVIEHDHGEIGPMLHDRDHEFTGPSDLDD